MSRRIETGRCELKVSLPLPLARAFKSAIHDPIRDRAIYGRAGTIIAGLLRKWLRDQGLPTAITPGVTRQPEDIPNGPARN